jgi:magnesium chelatase accessory protein
MNRLPPDWPNAAASRFVRAGSLEWHVQVMGEGPPLLLLHGTGAATHSWRDMMALLADQTKLKGTVPFNSGKKGTVPFNSYRVIACDLPGHGFTRGSLGAPSLPAVAKAVAGLMDAMEIEPEAIVGHSAGAAVALRMTLDGLARPKAIVALSPALLPFPGIAQHLFPAMAKLLFVNPFAPHIFAQMARGQGTVGRFLERSTGSTIDAAGVAHYARLFGDAKHCAGALAMMANWNLATLKADLPKLEVPLLVLHGEKDSAIPLAAAREATALVPGAAFEMLPGLGHLAHEEAADAVAARITGFIADYVAARSSVA